MNKKLQYRFPDSARHPGRIHRPGLYRRECDRH